MLEIFESVQAWLVAIVVILGTVYYLTRPKKPKTPTFMPTPITVTKSVGAKKKIKKKAGGPPVKIFYGSQTGTAEDFSNTLSDEAIAHNFDASVVDLEEYDAEDLASEPFAIFVVATYGEGEPTDNAKEFYDWMFAEEREPNCLEGLKYTVFGLGNRTYEHFNKMARDFDERLEALGATRIADRGEGDDDSSLEEDFEQWKGKVWAPICKAFGMEASATITEKKCNFDLKYRDDLKDNSSDHCGAITWKKGGHGGSIRTGLKVDQKNPRWCKILVNRELHSDQSDRSCRHIEIDIEGVKALNYSPGDHLGVYPQNESSVIAAVAKRLNLDLDRVIELVSKEDGKAQIGPCTIRHCLSAFVDLTSPPRRSVLQGLAQYCSDEQEKEKMKALASTEDGSKPYNDYIKNAQRTIGEVLDDYTSCNPPFEHLLELLPFLAPRYYSISSSMKENPGRVHITAVLVDFKTPTGRLHKGVATHWLRFMEPTDDYKPEIPIFVRRSQFKLPPVGNKPILMIGPGTGLAPFRGFIQERKHVKDAGKSMLFFGCRKRDVDYIYGDELEQAAKDGTLSELVLAFSREQADKVYVQHKLKEHKEAVWEILQNGYVYVCGDARLMAKDVHKALQEICVEVGGMSEAEALSYVTKMEASGKYQKDVWY